MNKSEVINELIKQFNKNNVTSIEVAKKGYLAPKSIGFKNARSSFKPDIIVGYGNKKDYYSIEERFSKSQLSEMISKWILLSLEARKNKGKLFVVVPEKLQNSFDSLIQDKQISAKILAV